ncbi:hypothetical protein [Salinibacterium sp. ZJ450]|uniref:hypothetical protein n=1 Tax=Salinibacterium sp. ZJ450 TaxID=2708338 RepID=UPI00142034F5|nr:hypothetical protein [Salinibacterium sp. ZJ450]
MDFDLDRMGWRQFEHLVQALSLAELGNGVQIFGDGVDGGREATFDGPVQFPQGSGELWDGYGIIQAKHRTFPGDPQKNADEVIAQIRTELSKFEADVFGAVKRKRKPKYFLFATNVRLSPGDESGGIDRVEAELESWETKLNLKGTFVWHYANICRMLEKHESIRRSFAGFVTPGDVLSELMNHFGVATGAIATQLRVHAAQQLRSRQWVDLGDSGGDGDDRLALSQVGIDLPAIIPARLIDSGAEEPAREVRVLQHVVERGDTNLRDAYDAGDGIGIVIVGGPGQGKSTIGHLICQAYRVALLSDAAASLPGNIKPVLEATRAHMAEMGVAVPVNRRWPIYVELSKFGDAVAADPETSLLKHIASGITVEGETLRANQLNKWKADWPWLVVLDGLDEVAEIETRQRVVNRIADFVTESRLHNHDVLIVATTRPQGYREEFAEFEPERLELRSLTSAEGLDYGKRLVEIRHAPIPDKIPDITMRLEAATHSDLTSRLMRSPLQVTIMAILLESVARVPSTKHALFDAYYKTIYSREVGRAGNLGSLLELHREHIDFVHEQVGLRLQIKSEMPGESEAMLSDQDLEQLFRVRLTKSGFEEPEVTRLSTNLMNAAKNRVVLLVGKQAGHVAFEVRSLQEYMAARALSTGPDDKVLDRIDALAPSSFWRHTMLLFLGRAFTKEHLRDSIIVRIRQLDTGSSAGLFLGYGEMLAIDLLEDDVAVTVPRVRRTLLEHSLGALRRWPRPELLKLATVAKPFVDTKDATEATLVRRLITEAFESSGRAHISAVLVLKTWKNKPGLAGAFANLMLERNQNWRPDPARDRDVRPKYSARDIFADSFPDEDLAEDKQVGRDAILTLLNNHKMPRDTSAAEASSYALQRAKLTDALPLQPLFEDPELEQRMMQAVDSLSTSDAVAATWMQQIISIVDERRPVGTDPRITELVEAAE